MSLLYILVIVLAISTIYCDLIWNKSVSLPQGLAWSAVGTNRYQTLIYTLGGLNNSGGDDLWTIYQFNGTNFKEVGSYNFGFLHCIQCSTTIDDIIYFASFHGRGIGQYNTASLELESYIGFPTAWSFPGCLTSNDTHLFMIGTQNCTSTACYILLIYDIGAKSWWNFANIAKSTKMVDYASVYVFGGSTRNQSANHSEQLDNEIMSYHLIDNEWSTLNATLTVPLASSYAIMPSNDGVFYIFGGNSNFNITSNVDVFNVNTNKVSSSTPMLSARDLMMVAMINGKIYVMGGTDVGGGDYLATTEVATIDPTKTPTNSPTNSPSNSPTNTPTSPTSAPSKAGPHDIVNISWTTNQVILYGSGIIGAIIFACFGLRCYKKLKNRNNNQINEAHASFDGVNNSNASRHEGQIVDTMRS